jgi:hypothetical protein
MSKRKKAVFTVSVLFVLVLGSVLLFPDHTNCDAPVILGNRGRADLIIADLISQTGGLPKPGVGATRRIVTKDNVHPVDDWEIERVHVGNTVSLLGSLTDDDPVFAYTIDFRAVYADGSQERLRWSSWRYGLVVCPFVLSGDGPSGSVEILPGS